MRTARARHLGTAAASAPAAPRGGTDPIGPLSGGNIEASRAGAAGNRGPASQPPAGGSWGSRSPGEHITARVRVACASPHTTHTDIHTPLPPATARRRNLNPAAGRPSWGGPPQLLRMACPLPGSGRRGLWPCPPAAHRGRRDERRRRVTPSAPAAGAELRLLMALTFSWFLFLK